MLNKARWPAKKHVCPDLIFPRANSKLIVDGAAPLFYSNVLQKVAYLSLTRGLWDIRVENRGSLFFQLILETTADRAATGLSGGG